jgi:hypothetical protein
MATVGKESNISSVFLASEKSSANLPNDAISFLEALHTRSHFIDLTGYIAAEDGGPLMDKDARVLHVAIQRVDGDGSILDDDLTGTYGGHWGILHLKRSASLDEVCSLILGGSHLLG